jgi:hypothetical protein
MPKPIARSPGILDGMILMVGVAIAMLFTRLYLEHGYNDPFFAYYCYFPVPDRSTMQDHIRQILGEPAQFAFLWLAALTPVAFLIRLRRPRPVLTRLLLQPGASALFAVMIIILTGSIPTAITVALEGSGPWYYYYQTYLFPLFPYAGAAVAVVWALQALGKRWKSEPGMIDRFGRFLGICWIVTFLAVTSASLRISARDSQHRLDTSKPLEADIEKMKAQENEQLAIERQSMEGQLQTVDDEQSDLRRLIDSGDQERWKAELTRQLQLLDEKKQTIRSEFDQLGKDPFIPPLPAGKSIFDIPK